VSLCILPCLLRLLLHPLLLLLLLLLLCCAGLCVIPLHPLSFTRRVSHWMMPGWKHRGCFMLESW